MNAQLREVRQLPAYNPRAMPAFESDALTFHLELYRRIGPLYRTRIGLFPMLAMGGPEANEFIYKHGDLWSYGQRMRFCREIFDETCVLQLDGQAHTGKRQGMAQAMKQSSLPQYAPAMRRAVLARLAALPDGFHPDLGQLGKHLTIGMTGVALIGHPLTPALADQIDLFSRNMIQSDHLGLLRHIWYLSPRYRRVRRGLLDAVADLLDQRAAHGQPENDMLAAMIQARAAAGQPMGRAEIISDVLFLLEAGASTAGQILAWALMYVYHHPEWLAALRAELAGWRTEDFQDLQAYPRLRATVLEIERLRPPVPYFILRPAREFVYQDVRVPARTRIFHVAALPHLLSEIYEDPLSFKPDRFLNDPRLAPRTHTTFGGGRHLCVGQPLARMEIALAIAEIVTTYDLIFDPAPSFRPVMDTVIAPANPVPTRFVPYQA